MATQDCEHTEVYWYDASGIGLLNGGGAAAYGRCANCEEVIPTEEEKLDRACRWNAFVVHLHKNYSYLLNHDLAMQIAREAQDHFEDGE